MLRKAIGTIGHLVLFTTTAPTTTAYTWETGFCVTAAGKDQQSGVHKLSSASGFQTVDEQDCYDLCAYDWTGDPWTACEAITGVGCFVHTQEVDRGSGHLHPQFGTRHWKCWVRAKESVTTDPPTTTALTTTTPAPETEFTSTSFEEMSLTDFAKINDYTFLKNHGCNGPALYNEFAIGGEYSANITGAGDEIDSACHKFRRCMTCAARDTDCDNINFDDISFAWSGVSGNPALCGNNTEPCAAKKCACNVEFMNYIIKKFETQTPTAVVATIDQCNAKAGDNRECCIQSDKTWKMFNGVTHKCENGEILLAGKIPSVSTCNGKQIDVTMFVDGSGSVSYHHFHNSVIPFCNDFAAALKLSDGGIHMQFFQWSRYGRLEFGYQTDAATFKTLTASISYYDSVTYTYENLKQCYENHIKNSGRAAAKKVIVNITDGKPTGDTVGDKVRDYVRDVLTPDGVVHIVVGVGTGIPWSTLVNMSTIKNTAIHQGETTFLAGLDRDSMSAIGNQIGEEVCR